MLKLYRLDHCESGVNCYFDAFYFHCNGVYEEDELVVGEFADFCSKVKFAFRELEYMSSGEFISDINDLK